MDLLLQARKLSTESLHRHPTEPTARHSNKHVSQTVDYSTIRSNSKRNSNGHRSRRDKVQIERAAPAQDEAQAQGPSGHWDSSRVSLGWGYTRGARVDHACLSLSLASSTLCATMPFMLRSLTGVALAICVGAIALAALGPMGFRVDAQEEPPVAVLLDGLNSVRLDEGLDPYRRSRLLDDAAQRHASDLAANGFADPDDPGLGSDGSSEQDRIREAGYAAWTENEQLVVGESVWAGTGTPSDVLASLLEDPTHRENLLSEAYREVGIGLATNGDGQGYYVINVGARPNVLPIFINDGAPGTENREVAIRLTNERVRPEGRGTAFIGEAIEMRISDEPTFEGLSWQPWTPLVSWILAETAGEQTVYVQFRDAARRTAAAADSIFLGTDVPATPASVSGTPSPDPTASPAAGLPVTEVPPSTDRELDPPDGPVTAEPTPDSPSEAAPVTPFPTWTPLPSPEPTGNPLSQPDETALNSTAMANYTKPLAIVGVLQGAALVLGVYLMMRRGGASSRER